MLEITGTNEPWLNRLDHLICEVPDIDRAIALFTSFGFPVAWPKGRFWPQGLTAGIALGGLNLEFIQLDAGAPDEPAIRTLVFEPVNLDSAVHQLQKLGFPLRVADKWESNPELLKLRGFHERDCQTPQLICQNAFPESKSSFDFFICAYSEFLKMHLVPSAFPNSPKVHSITLGTPKLSEDWAFANTIWGLPSHPSDVTIQFAESLQHPNEVVEIATSLGSLDLSHWTSRFRFT